MIKTQLVTSFIFLLFLGSCFKESDDSPPKIVINKPSENAFFMPGDTITIDAEISDNELIAGIEISLANENFTPVLKTYTLPVHGNPEHLIFSYPLNDKYLPTGRYYVSVKASDNYDSKNKYRAVNITGIARRTMGLALITHKRGGLQILSADSALSSAVPWFSVVSDYSGSAYLPYHNIFVSTSATYGKAEAYDYFTKGRVWTLQTTAPPPFPTFTGAFAHGKYLDILYYEGKVERYNYKGIKKMTMPMPVSYMPVLTAQTNRGVLVYAKKQYMDHKGLIALFYNSTGAMVQSYFIDFDVVAFYARNDKEAVVLGNDKNGNALVRIYYFDENTFSKPRDLPSGKMLCCANPQNNIFLFVQNGDLKELNLNDNTLFTKMPAAAFEIMKYEPVDALLYVKKGNSCVLYTYPALQQVNSITPQDTLLDFQIIYNL